MAFDAQLEADYIKRWLEEVARNTAQTRDAVEGMGKAKGAGGGTPAADPAGSRWERVSEMLAARFESAISKMSRTPAEKLASTGLDRASGLLESAASSLLSSSRNFANRGFNGTVEKARFDFATEQLSKQFAAIMKPILDGMTYGAVEIERRMRGLSGGEQNRLLGAGIGGVAGLRYAGPLGAFAGAAAGSIAMGGAGTYGDGGMGAAAGAYAGMRVAGPWGAAVGAAGGYVAGRGDYSRMRESGKGRFVSGAVAAGAALGDAWYGVRGLFTDEESPIDAARRDWDTRRSPRARERAGAETARREVTPFSADPLAAGGTADNIQRALIRATAGADYEDNGPLKPIIDMMLKIFDVLMTIATGGSYTPPPRPAS